MKQALKTLIFGASILFFTAILGLFANAGYYSFHFGTCCASIGIYNAQGDPSYYRYDPYVQYDYADPYPTRSLPSYPYEFYQTTYPQYVYSYYYTYPTYYYPQRVYVSRNSAYNSYGYRID